MPIRSKWVPLVDDTNPRKARPYVPKEIRLYKPWTRTGQMVKAIEELSPTTPREVFKSMVERRVVPNTDIGLRDVRRSLTELRRHKTIIVDVTVRKFVAQEYGTESLIILNPKRKYKFVEDNH